MGELLSVLKEIMPECSSLTVLSIAEDKVEPKKAVQMGLSAPSTVRKSAKVAPKNLNSQTTVKCVLRGTDPESKALAAYKCKLVSYVCMYDVGKFTI